MSSPYICESSEAKNNISSFGVITGEDQILSRDSKSHIFDPLLQQMQYTFLSEDAKKTLFSRTAGDAKKGFVRCLSHIINPFDCFKQYIEPL
jgi:hypothetical protein